MTSLLVRDREATTNLSAYVRAQLFHKTADQEWQSKVVECKGVSADTGADMMWNERFEWLCDRDELAFLR
jgi:phosphatidylinositol phospholipase C, delta